MSAFANNPSSAHASNVSGGGSGGVSASGLGAGVKKKVTKKRRNILASQTDDCQGEEETERGAQLELSIASKSNHSNINSSSISSNNNNNNNHVNGNTSREIIDSQSNQSDSDIMIIECRAPVKSRTSMSNSMDGRSSGLTGSMATVATSIESAPEQRQARISAPPKSTSNQLSSSQTSHAASPLTTTKTLSSPPQAGSLTPPRPPIEVERGQLKKQIEEALKNQQSTPKIPSKHSDSLLRASAASTKDSTALSLQLAPEDNQQMPQSSISPTRGSFVSTQLSKSPASSQKKTPKKSYYDTRGSQFTWDTYLEIYPAEPAPREAFRQPKIYPKNMFIPGMMLKAKDPRKGSDPAGAWALAKVVGVEGLHIRLRFLGTDAMNDLHELIDSENIQPLDDNIDKLFAPTGYNGNIGQYQKYVEKIMRKDLDCVAPQSIFHETPLKPKVNMFERGMKLEAVDRKNRDFIYPATVGDISGDMIKVVFDGWRGSFDYYCEYYSRDIFPINWCRDVGRPIQGPNGWLAMLEKGPIPRTSPQFHPYLGEPKASASQTKSVKLPQGATICSQAKKRGRPKGSTGKKVIQTKSYSSPPKSRESTVFREPKVKTTPIESDEHPNSSEDVDSHVVEEDNEDLEAPVDPYQCQRTVTYREWQQKKKLQEELARQNSMGDTKESDISINLSSSSLSDTVSTASFVLASRDLTDFDDDSSKVKKQKIEDSLGTSNVSTSSKLEQIVASKPKRLSKWSVADVIDIIKIEGTLGKYVQVFQDNEIDGLAFGLFGRQKTELLMQMGLKMGPVLKILDLRERVIPHLDIDDIINSQ